METNIAYRRISAKPFCVKKLLFIRNCVKFIEELVVVLFRGEKHLYIIILKMMYFADIHSEIDRVYKAVNNQDDNVSITRQAFTRIAFCYKLSIWEKAKNVNFLERVLNRQCVISDLRPQRGSIS
ncbi:hypothetical protein QNI16_36370 [Cytophagaceae bacterium YF14B1]|uniref:Uncharacterized protein n=1 Tax=Xanthocytophaga flava TaxID=3048013 RepID=A0AAE3UAC5_9BACT|nr:hypothetical protein [Xanthocytophaga flavus]MDJ1486014.1 hypothetical protein [Xanthocytophaga flavus]